MQNAVMPQLTELAELDRRDLIDRLLHFPGTFKFDFTPEYVEGLSTDELRHILMAAYLHAYQKDRR